MSTKRASFFETIYSDRLKPYDFKGEADYLSENGLVAMEVTSHWDEENYHRSLQAAEHSLYILTPHLRWDWLVWFDGYPKNNFVRKTVTPLLATLETHEIEKFYSISHAWWMKHAPTLTGSIEALREAKVGYAIKSTIDASDLKPSDNQKIVWIIPSGNYVFGGPNSALENFEDFIENNFNDLRKLRETGATSCHYWIWINSFTDKSMLDAFKVFEATSLPARNPALPQPITHLWIVNEDSLKGWHFNSQTGWQIVSRN